MTEQQPGSGRRIRDDDSGVEIFDEDDIEAERERRLDADHRPSHAEVDNTHREFDPEVGMFTDNEEYDAHDKRYALDPESGGGR